MAIGEIKDLRKEYAAQLRKMADRVENAPVQPVGTGIFFFWANQTITEFAKREDGFSPLLAAGLYLRQAGICSMVLPSVTSIPDNAGPLTNVEEFRPTE